MSVASGNPKKRVSRGWWRLLAVLLFALAVTVGLGFYLPLRESHELLVADFSNTQTNASALSAILEQTRTALQTTTAERDELRAFKSDADTHRQRYAERAERLRADAKSVVQAALDKKRLEVKASDQGVTVNWLSPLLFTRARNATNRTGQALLCPLVEGASELGMPQVTIRTFVPSGTTDVKAALITATELASAIGYQVLGLCSTSKDRVIVSSALQPPQGAAPLLQFIFTDAAEGTATANN